MTEKDITAGLEKETLSAAELSAKLRKERMKKRDLKIEKRNAVIARKNELLAEKYGFNQEKTSVLEPPQNKESEFVRSDNGIIDEPVSISPTTTDSPTSPLSEATVKTSDNKKKAKKEKRCNRFASVSFVISLISLILAIFLVLACAPTILNSGSAIPGASVAYIHVDSGTVKGDSYDSYSDMIEDAMKSVVIVYGQSQEGSSTGTGAIITADGYIITNYHVVEGCTSIQVMLKDSEQYTSARLVGYKIHDDIAVLKIEQTELRPITFATSKNCRVGEKVFAIGCPLGADYAWSVTQGIISSPRRQLKIYDTTTGTLQKKMLVMQTDVAVNPGNSGGPIINTSGQMVGVITMKLTDSSGMGFALPSDEVLQMVTGIIERGTGFGVDSTIATGRPLIGITGVGVEKGTYYRLTMTGVEIVSAIYAEKNPATSFLAGANGVYITNINKGADAKGKLQEGDIITHLNGATVFNVTQVSEIINDMSGGDTVDLTVYRNGQNIDVTITLGVEELP